MQLSISQIINLPVFTQSNQSLGKISGIEIDTETQKISYYHIKSNSLITNIFAKELVVAAKQVISISEEKMIVEDLIIKEKEAVFSTSQLAKNKPIPSPNTSRG